MPGITFIHAGILAGLGAVSIPIIIHLLNRLRFREVEWAAMEFLLEVNKRYRRRLRLEHLLLLLLRMLAIALLVLAVSRPLLKTAGVLPLPGAVAQTEWVMLLDDSASMEHRFGEQSAFERGKEVAADWVRLIAEKHPGDLVTLVRTSRPDLPDVIGQGVGGERVDAIMETLKSLTRSDHTFNVANALKAVHKRLGEEREGRGLSITVISDFCRTDWGGRAGRDRQGILDAIAQFRGVVRGFTLIDVGGEDRENVGVVAVESKERNIVAGVQTSLSARLKNFGTRPAEGVRVSLSVGEITLPAHSLPLLQPQETVAVSIPYGFQTPGSYPVRVSATSDRFPVDDTRFLAVEVRDAVHVLLVDGERGSETEESESFYLAKALAPPGSISSGIAVDVIPDYLLEDHDLSPYHAIFLCNLYRIPREKVGMLERFVREGGGLVLFLGDQVEPESYNVDLYAEGKGLLPVRIGESRGVEGEGGFVSFLPETPEHPLARIFRSEEGAAFGATKIFRFSTVVKTDLKEGIAVLLRFSDADRSPAALERSFGKGQVVLFTTACDMEWGRWPTEFNYLLAVQELMRILPGAKSLKWNEVVGSPLVREIDASQYALKATLRTPNFPDEEEKVLLAALQTDQKNPVIRYPGTQLAGFYTLGLQGRKGDKVAEVHAFNLDPEEGNLARVSDRELERLFGDIPVQVVKGKPGGLQKEQEEGREIWRSLIWILIVLLMVEGALALKFGHHQGGPVP
ncbi:MAG: BatA domain-containing protein [Planctomycetota bacterium]|jgi:hypothetical protein